MTSILPPSQNLSSPSSSQYHLWLGAVSPFISPEWFIAEQIAQSPLEPVSPNARMVAYQLGNIYLLLAMVGIAVLYTTTEIKVVRNYVIALWLADVGHVAVTCYGLEYERTVDIGNWNAMTWGNVGVTLALFATRTVYLLGGFGPSYHQSPAAKKLQ